MPKSLKESLLSLKKGLGKGQPSKTENLQKIATLLQLKPKEKYCSPTFTHGSQGQVSSLDFHPCQALNEVSQSPASPLGRVGNGAFHPHQEVMSPTQALVVIGYHMGSLDFRLHQAVRRYTFSFLLGWYQRVPTGESGSSPYGGQHPLPPLLASSPTLLAPRGVVSVKTMWEAVMRHFYPFQQGGITGGLVGSQ